MSSIFRLLFIVISISTFSCGSDEVKSTWTSNGLHIDGQSGDWDNLPVHYNEDLEMAYGLANCDTSLYLMIRFKDERIAKIMAVRGFEIWFDDLNEDDLIFGIRYRIPNANSEHINMKTEQSNKNSMRTMPNAVFTLIKKDDDAMSLPLVNHSNFNAAFGFNKGMYCIEYKIPLYSGEDLPFEFEVNAAKEVEIGAVLKALDRPSKMNMSGGEKSQGSGRGSRGGGKRGGGVSGGGRNDQPSQVEEKEIWLKVRLSDTV